MKKTIYQFNNLLRTYFKYQRKLKNLKTANKNERRQHILQNHIAKLYEKLMVLKMSVKLSTATTVVATALAFTPQSANSQTAFVYVQNNPFGLTNIGSYSSPTFADLDGDGDLDLMAGENNGDFNYFQNTGTATAPVYAPVQTNPFGLTNIGLYSSPTFADLDGDSDLDLMAGEYYGDFSFYRRCLPTADTISPTVACSYTSPSGQLHLTSGSFTDVIPNATGCDSIITINLTVNPLIDQTVSSTNPVACNSGSTTIDLGSSQSGINYFLRNNANDTIVDGPVAGTGTGLSFNTGTINAPTTYNVYGVGTAPSTGLVFDGIDDYVDAGTGINLTNSSFSIEFWAKKKNMLTTNDNHIIGLGETTATNNALHIGFRNTNQFTFAFFGNDLDASSTLADTNWHHWAVTFDAVSKARTIYRDGVQVANDVASSNFIGTGNLKIGRAYFANNNNFNGNLDEVRVWNGAKTVSEINATMNTCLSGTETGLLAYYQFENGAGSSTLTDISPNGNNGTLTNMNPATDWGTGSSVCSTCNIEMTQTITINVGQHSTSSITETACNSYTSPSGNFTWVTSGVFSDTIPNVSGCDSVITVNLTINTVDNTTTLNVNTVTANQTGATYQWLDCNNANAVIIGAIAQSFTPTVTGNYAVEVTMNGCSDTSACVNVIITSINELALAGIKIYPNPVNDNIFIELANLAQATKITIVSIDGKEVYSNATINSNKLAIDAAAWSKGVYFITITSDKNSNTMKLIKQ